MAAFSFPSLKVREIVQCMNELHIPTVEADLKDPQVRSCARLLASKVSDAKEVTNRDGSTDGVVEGRCP